MIYGEAGTTVTATPREVLDLVCDVERYRLADTKIKAVVSEVRDGDATVLTLRTRLRGVPAPPVRQRVVRTGDDRVDITSVASWQGRIATFRGYVTCRAAGGVTEVWHREEFHAARLLEPVVALALGDWLRRDVAAEVGRLRELLGVPADGIGV